MGSHQISCQEEIPATDTHDSAVHISRIAFVQYIYIYIAYKKRNLMLKNVVYIKYQ